MRKIIIFAGGLGKRLKGTENRPKPLVKIGSVSFLTILINTLHKEVRAKEYNILTCSDQLKFFNDWKISEMKDKCINIISEDKRTGRTGALVNFFNLEGVKLGEQYALMNGDTFIKNFDILDIDKCYNINSVTGRPTALLLQAKNRREDSRNMIIENKSLVNSGFLVLTGEWLMKSIQNKNYSIDIDDIIFQEGEFDYVSSTNTMVDIGTPTRLKLLREEGI